MTTTTVAAQLQAVFDTVFAADFHGVLVSDAQGRIVLANTRLELMFGYGNGELLGQPVDLLVPDAARQAHAENRARFAHETTQRAMAPIRHLEGRRKDGDPVSIEVSLRTFALEGEDMVAAFVREIAPRTQTERLLQSFADRVDAVGEGDFFRSAVGYVADVLGVSRVVIGEISDHGARVSTLAVWSDGAWKENFTYELEGTPCAGLLDKSICWYESDVQRQFPHDRMLADLGAEAYIGVPIHDEEQRVIGVMSIISTHPLKDGHASIGLLRMLAGFAGGEIRHRKQEAAMRLQNRLLEMVGQAVVATDLEGRVTYWNAAAASMHGFSAEEALGQPYLELTHAQVGLDAILKGVSRAEPSSLEIPFVGRDGEKRLALVGISPLIGDSGDVIGMIGVAMDVTDARQAEGMAAEHHDLLRTLMETSPDPIYAKDASGRYILANTAAATVLGLETGTDVVGRRDKEFVAGAALKRVRRADNEVMQTGEPQILEELAPSGRWYRSTKSALRNAAGNTYGIVGAAVDVTESRRAHEALSSSEAFGRAILNSINTSLAVTDTLGVIIGVNETWRRFASDHGGDAALREGVGVNYLDVCREGAAAGAEGARQALHGLTQVLKGERAEFGVEYPCSGPGEERWFLMYVTSLDVKEGGAVILHIDITDGRRVLDMEASLRAARATEAFKAGLFGTLSHELRTPLTVIRGLLTTITEYRERLDSAEMVALATDADRAARELDDLIGAVLAMSRVGSTGFSLNMRQKSIQDVVGEAVSARRIHSPRRRVRIKSRSPAEATVDPVWFGHAIANLLDNADKYSPEQMPIDVTISHGRRGNVRVAVRDFGTGVPPDQLEAIFAEFTRLQDRRHERGSGLGLSICRSIMAAHGGRVFADLPRGGGLRVTLELPAAELASPAP